MRFASVEELYSRWEWGECSTVVFIISLGPLVKKIKDNQIEVIINSLCSNMFSSSERLRDISSVGLKTVISEFPRTTQAVSTTASRNITGKMVDAIGKPVGGVKECELSSKGHCVHCLVPRI